MDIISTGAEVLNETIVMNSTFGFTTSDLLSYAVFPQADKDGVDYDMAIWRKKIHAWVATAAWCFLASFMVIVNRHIYGYMWRYFFWVHSVCGSLVLILNFGTSYYAIHSFRYQFLHRYVHTWVVIPLMFLLFLIVFHGIYTKQVQYTNKWNTRGLLDNRAWHRWTGYIFIHIGHWGIFTGGGIRQTLTTVFWFYGILFLFEIWHQFDRRREIPFKTPPTKISHAQFMEMVESGHKVAVIDDLVVDMEKYLFYHPGGAFVLTQNVGRDISKYFHGAFSLENMGKNKVHNWYHSTQARRIVNDIAIGRYIKRAEVRLCSLSVDRNTNHTGTCKTIRFRSIYDTQKTMMGGAEVPTYNENLLDESANRLEYGDGMYACPLIDHTSVARHYLIKSTSHPETLGGPSREGEFDDTRHGIRRQYTECFCMRKNVYESILKIANQPDNSQAEIKFLKHAVNQYNANGVCLSIKAYEEHTGLSTFIFNNAKMNNKHIFECKGPMGSGLACSQTGRHVAYSAGTGVLVFLDLVGYLVIRILDKHCGTDINTSYKNAANTSKGDITNQSMDNPYNKSREEALKGNGGLNYSERTKGLTQSGASMTQSSFHSKAGGHKKEHGSPEPLDLNNFQFDLHTSFASEEEAMGLEIIDLLVELCEKYGYKNLFTHYSRISKVKKDAKLRQPQGKRFDEAAYKEEFERFEKGGQVEKVYVCGPPVMQEHFDRAQDAIPNKRIDYHVL